MKNFKKSKTKTSKAKTSKTKTPEYFSEESFVLFFFSRQSISVLSAECLKSVKSLENEEFQEVESYDLGGRVEKNVSGHPDLRWFPLIKI